VGDRLVRNPERDGLLGQVDRTTELSEGDIGGRVLIMVANGMVRRRISVAIRISRGRALREQGHDARLIPANPDVGRKTSGQLPSGVIESWWDTSPVLGGNRSCVSIGDLAPTESRGDRGQNCL